MIGVKMQTVSCCCPLEVMKFEEKTFYFFKFFLCFSGIATLLHMFQEINRRKRTRKVKDFKRIRPASLMACFLEAGNGQVDHGQRNYYPLQKMHQRPVVVNLSHKNTELIPHQRSSGTTCLYFHKRSSGIDVF